MVQDPPPSDAELLHLLRRWYDGDQQALATLVAAIEPWLQQDVRARLRGDSSPAIDPADVVQQAIVNFLQWGPRFQPESSAQLRALLQRIATNQLIDELRRSERRTSCSDTLSGSARRMSGYTSDSGSSLRPERHAVRNEEREWLRLGLQFLDEDERYLLIASEVDGLPWKDIAAQLRMDSPDAARVRAGRLKIRLANILRQLKGGRTPRPDAGDREVPS